MAIKFAIFQGKGKNKQWYWNAQSSGNIIFAGGEGYEKPQKLVTTVRKNIVREDEKLEAALVKALKEAGLNEKGAAVKDITVSVKTPEKKPKEKVLKAAVTGTSEALSAPATVQ